uniref:Uncharacterized protein n=1 Tax=Cebus imitator TaxID=2715852 RepID=A0A2K5RSA4_CEBIM
MRNSAVCPTRLLWRLSPSWGLATCKNLESGAGEVVRGSDSLRLRTTGSTRILWEDRAVSGAPQVSGAPRRGRARTRQASAPAAMLRATPVLGCSAATCGAAGRVLPVDLERERAALCAWQSGHDPPAAWWLLGSRSAESGAPARSRVAAELAEPGATLICQSALETSAFPPSALKSPRGRAQAPSRCGQPRQPRGNGLGILGQTARSARGRPETPTARSCEAAKLPGNVGKWWEPHKFGEVGNQPWDS